MHGRILNWNGASNSGVVVTEGGERYAFGPTDFKSAAQPRAGLKVDFANGPLCFLKSSFPCSCF